MNTVGLGRFAPSTTGRAHPGTLLSALLCWLDARSRGDRILLRLEDLDPERTRPEHVSGLVQDLAWLGLDDWDATERQSESGARHAAALDRLADTGRLYACTCSRKTIREGAERAPDGGFRYPNTCRSRVLERSGERGWRASEDAIRVRLDDEAVVVDDESDEAHVAHPARAFGDPVVRRRDGAVAYHLASVVDDAAAGVTRIVRGRDLAPSTSIQRAIARALELPSPTYHHHFLVLESSGGKLAKLHGAVDAPTLASVYSGAELCGLLAGLAGLLDGARPTTPAALACGFDWRRVVTRDRVLEWTGEALRVPSDAEAS